MINLRQIENLSISEIEELILGKEEGKFLEFKSDIKLETIEEKKEFLADLSSFVNANGGDLLIGVSAKTGIAERINGISIENFDSFKLRIENLVRDSIEPRIPPIIFQRKEITSGNSLIVITIKESYNKPHAVILNKSLRVYSRNSSGKYPLDITEVKDLVLGSSNAFDKINSFRQSRLFSIINHEIPHRFENEENAKFAIHIIPQQAFYQKMSADFNEIRKWTNLLLPLNSDYCQQRLNFDGIFTYVANTSTSSVTKYFQLFRNGIVESINGCITTNYPHIEKGIWASSISKGTLSLVRQAIQIYQNLEVTPPFYVFISLLGVTDHVLILDPQLFAWEDSKKFDRDQLICPEVVITDYDVDLEKEFQPVFDMIWNAVGFDRAYE